MGAVWFGWSDCSDYSDGFGYSGYTAGNEFRLATGVGGDRPSAVDAFEREEGLSLWGQYGSAGVIVRTVATASEISVARLETISVWPLASAGTDPLRSLPSSARKGLSQWGRYGSAGVIVRAVATASEISVARLETSSIWPLASAGTDLVWPRPLTADWVCR